MAVTHLPEGLWRWVYLALYIIYAALFSHSKTTTIIVIVVIIMVIIFIIRTEVLNLYDKCAIYIRLKNCI